MKPTLNTNNKNIRLSYFSFLSPVGWLTVFEEDDAIIAVEWGQAKKTSKTSLLKEAQRQIEKYFSGNLKVYKLPLNPSGTEFQKCLWQKISLIPYGETTTYGNLGNTLKTAPRAIGGACGKNPIPILIPCHRVIGIKNKLTGFSRGNGIKTKEILLSLELTVKNISK
jgi:methylated-DNA-[protein]-cysteine S-methyltransferase